ncbi:MAG: response regulator transcription factor [Pseudomonadota bacterium]|nr:response regulator transcription factor [Pseudomonadota bacterium]
MKIILADDHPLFRDGFSLLISQMEAGVVVIQSCSLDEALEQARCHPDLDLLMLDLYMPGMAGESGLARVFAEFSCLPVVIMSGSDNRDDMERVLASGASGFIPKMSTSQVMLSAVKLVLSGGIYVPPQMLLPVKRDAPANDQAAHLTDRQREVLKLLVEGKPNKSICRELGMSEGTVKSHIAAILRALNANNRTEAAAAARRLGVIA